MTEKDQVARDILSDITVHMKYARYLPEKERRETWSEIVDRNKAMHQKKYPELAQKKLTQLMNWYMLKKCCLLCAQCSLVASLLK